MTKAELIKNISDAFQGVKLGNGVGLWEARLIDDYHHQNSPEYIRAQKEDEREDWSKLLPIFYHQEKLENYITDTWSFMDAQGVRFHLPCFLLQDIEMRSEEAVWDNPLIYTLVFEYKDSGTEFSSFDRLKILNAVQKKAVLDFLNYKIEQFFQANRENEKLEYQTAKENFVKYIMNGGN